VHNLAQARKEAKEYAVERRREIRKRVRALRLEEEARERERSGD
jgi:hypothetical protein